MKKVTISILVILKINECNSIEATNTYSNMSDQKIFRLNEINKIKDYFNSRLELFYPQQVDE